MTCPFCFSNIDDRATVCGACGAYIERISVLSRVGIALISPVVSAFFAVIGAAIVWLIVCAVLKDNMPHYVFQIAFFAIAMPIEIALIYEGCCKGDNAHWVRRF